jgi:Uma2 family endonuclease
MLLVHERQHVFSFEDYLVVAERSPLRLEFWGGMILDMPGDSVRHSAICTNVGDVLRSQLRGGRCRMVDSNFRVRAQNVNRATYADLTIACDPFERDPADKSGLTLLNPLVLVEVHSHSTESDDRGPKLDFYKAITSVRSVILVAQDRTHVSVHERQAAGGFVHTQYTTGTIELASIACQLPVARVYEGLPEI